MQAPLCALALVTILTLISAPVIAQEPDPIAVWHAQVNQTRLDEGLAPYGFSSLLNAAAQRHADDLAAHEIWSHTGSDGSTPRQRIAESGYAAWTWNSGELIAGENFWTGYGTIDDAMSFFLDDPPHRDNLLNTTYREIGVGVATDDAGRNYYVLDFGARPNVLPIFINDGAASTDDPQIALRLTNEKARPGGEGSAFMGQAIEMRISNEPQFDDAPWQSWDPLAPWTLPNTSGEHIVYVQLRDAAGRTAASADTIILGQGADVTPATIPASPTPEPTATPILPSPTPEPAATSIPPSPTPEPAAPTFTPAPQPVTTVEPIPTQHQTQPTAQPATPTPLPQTTPDTADNATPFPTWTPLPTPAPQKTDTPDAPLALLVTLQGLALTLGVYLALRRGRGSATD